MLLWFVAIGARRACRTSSRTPTCCSAVEPAPRASRSSPTTARTASCCSARSSCASPAARRSTRTWATSARRRSGSRGTCVVFPGAAAQLLRPGRAVPRARRARSRTRSTTSSPAPLLIPMVVLATMAAIIASQALISGAFSLTQPGGAARLLCRASPSCTRRHKTEGQIYIPEVNWLLMVACVALVLGVPDRRRRSPRRTASRSPARWRSRRICTSSCAAATGATRCATALALFIPFIVDRSRVLRRERRRRSPHGGWFPLAVGVGVFTS